MSRDLNVGNKSNEMRTDSLIREVSQDDFDAAFMGSGASLISNLLKLFDSGKGGLAISPDQANKVLPLLRSLVTTTYETGQVTGKGNDIFISLMRNCPRTVRAWRGYSEESLGAINIAGPSGSGKSAWVTCLHKHAIPIVDTDRIMRAIENLASGRDCLDDNFLFKQKGWFKACNERLRSGNARYAAASRQAAGLVESLRLITTTVAGWEHSRVVRPYKSANVLINPLLGNGWEEYVLTCLGRAATDSLKQGTATCHWYDINTLNINNAKVIAGSRSILEIPAYSSQDTAVINDVIEFLTESISWWANRRGSDGKEHVYFLRSPAYLSGWGQR